MHLTSEIEPAGLKSTNHYVVLHHNKRSDLITLPASYSDLEKQITKLYHIDPGRFHIESEELNLCKGKKVRIPDDAWGDIGRLLGNIHIIPNSGNDGSFFDHPESSPEVIAAPTSTSYQPPAPVHTANKGVIQLDSPLVKTEILLIKTGDIDYEAASTSSTKFNLQILDEKKTSVLTISFFPKSGWTFLASATNDTSISCSLKEAFHLEANHSIIVHKQGTKFLLLYDSVHVGTVDAPAHSALTSVVYDMGIQTPFRGPISAHVYTDLPHLVDEFAPYQAIFPSTDRETLYQQMLTCDPDDAPRISRALETIRREIASFKHSSSGTKWKGNEITTNEWIKFEWDMAPRSVFVTRFKIPEGITPAEMFIVIGPKGRYPLQVSMTAEKTVRFGEHNDSGTFSYYHTINIPDSLHTPGEHTVALINQNGSLRASVDFKTFTTVPKSTMITRKPSDLYFQVSHGCTVELDVYEFGR